MTLKFSEIDSEVVELRECINNLNSIIRKINKKGFHADIESETFYEIGHPDGTTIVKCTIKNDVYMEL